jgi:cobalt/nickel transport system permease protein
VDRFALQGQDPAAKLPVALLFAASACLTERPASALLCLGVALAAIGLARFPLRSVIRSLLPVNAFCLFLWLILPWSHALPGQAPLFFLGPLPVHRAGSLLALLITMKANAISGMALIMTGTSSPAANGRALLRLHVPEKLVTLILFTHANLVLLERESKRMWQAAKLRGFTPKNSFFTYRTCAWMAAMLLFRAWEKARRVEQAMRLRGFCGRFPLFAESAAARPSGFLMVLAALGPLILACDLALRF